MVERVRVFSGSNELDFSAGKLIKTNDDVVNNATLIIQGTASVTSSSVLDFKKNDGTTTVFSAKVIDIKTPDMWNMKLMTNGYELQNVRIENVYENISPEDLVKDIIDNRTSTLTFASSSSSGFTISRYIAQAYAIDVIKDMMDMLSWQLIIDENDNVFFQPQGETNNGISFTNGENIDITFWEADQNTLFNHVKVVGGFESFAVQGETVAGIGTTFLLSKKPSGAVRVMGTNGTTVPDDDYTVVAEDLKVIFDDNKAQTDPTFDFTYNTPVVVEDQNDSSITDRGEVFKEIQAPWLDNFLDARKYAQNLLNVFSSPLKKVKGLVPGLPFSVDVGEFVTVKDDIRGNEEQLVVRKIEYDLKKNNTKFEFGTRDFVFFDWQREVQDRVKKLERRFINQDVSTFSRNIKHGLKVSLAGTTNFFFKSANDTFILDHTTLGRFRSSFNLEADCSKLENNGTWVGSGIGGAEGTQFGTAGYRLSKGDFNGTDNEIQVSNTVTGVQSISMAIKPDTNTRDICQLTASDIVSIDGSNDITTSGLSNVTIYVENIETTAITLNDWNNVVITFDAVSSDAIKVGHSTSWYSGEIDEFTLFDKKIDSGERADIISKVFYSNKDVYTNCVLWFSMDNPRLDDRFSEKQTVR